MITRELAGPEAAEALRTVLASGDARSSWRERPAIWPDVLAMVP